LLLPIHPVLEGRVASLAVISSCAKTARSAWAAHALSAQRMMGVSEAPELQTSITLYLDRENLQPLKHLKVIR
ncbi:hypothetical protein JTL95_40395, partial [Pseudomonas aeruginosa]|nr:hypothetical protein [Pseudomonas aeruginosa]